MKVVKQGQKRPALLTQILEDEGWKKMRDLKKKIGKKLFHEKIRKFILILYYNRELKKYVKIALVELSFTVTQFLKKIFIHASSFFNFRRPKS